MRKRKMPLPFVAADVFNFGLAITPVGLAVTSKPQNSSNSFKEMLLLFTIVQMPNYWIKLAKYSVDSICKINIINTTIGNVGKTQTHLTNAKMSTSIMNDEPH